MTDFSKIKNLFNITLPVGFNKNEFQPLIERFGAIPTVLMDYYVELGAYKVLNQTQDFLITPNDISNFEDEDYLIFYSEAQSVSVWGIHKDDVSKENPPVYENYGDEQWYKTCDTLTEFLTSMAFLQAASSKNYSNGDFWTICQHDVDNIAQHFESKGADSGLYTGVRFFGNYTDSVIAVMNDNGNFALLFSSDSENHFEEMYTTLERITNNDGSIV